jgi:hypothetical protein
LARAAFSGAPKRAPQRRLEALDSVEAFDGWRRYRRFNPRPPQAEPKTAFARRIARDQVCGLETHDIP